MKQLFEKKELIGKTIKNIHIPEDSYGNVCIRFNDNSFVIFKIEDITRGHGYASDKISINDSTYSSSSHELMEVGLITKEEYTKAVEDQEAEWKKRSEESEKKLKKIEEDYELALLNKLKEKYEH